MDRQARKLQAQREEEKKVDTTSEPVTISDEDEDTENEKKCSNCGVLCHTIYSA